MDPSAPHVFSAIGKPVPRSDAAAKVTGRATYTGDLVLPGLLHAKILRSPHAHARVRRVDARRALALPGVKLVVTARDVPAVRYNTACEPPTDELAGPAADQGMLEEVARYVGDRVGAVVATDPRIAEEALSLVQVEYEPLPAVFDPEEALAANAPRVHVRASNLLATVPMGWGDVDEGLRAADRIFEDRYTVHAVQHCAIEPHVCICQWDAGGRLTVWASNQTPFHLRRMLAEVLNLPLTHVRIITQFDGGGFGGKQEMMDEPLCALLAQRTGRPVKIEYTRSEEFRASRTRHAAVLYVRTGVATDGTLTARSMRAILNTGAYASHGPTVTGVVGVAFCGLYRAPHVRFEGLAVYTNSPIAGAFRGYGTPQAHFAVESHMERIARELGRDPLDFRLRNAVQKGDLNLLTGWTIDSCALRECMELGAHTIGWGAARPPAPRPSRYRRGIGMARVIQPTSARGHIPEIASALLKVNEDGTVQIVSGTSDSGTGSSTALRQIAAETLGIPVEQVGIVSGDTDATPFDMGSYASRSTFVNGLAVREAALRAKRQILDVAAEMLEARPDDLDISEGKVFVAGAPSSAVSVAEVVHTCHYRTERAAEIIGTASEEPQNNAPSFGAHFAEVEVDTENGEVKVLRYVAAHDVGRAINPLAIEGQIEGGVIQGLGYALVEEMRFVKDGRLANPNFCDYKIWTSLDVPPIESLILEDPAEAGPFGAKGVGEAPLVPVAPCIANAVYDAIGVPVRDLPITPERVLRALRESAAR